MQVGIKEFRSNLRKWLDVVEKGEEITLTERGRPVARVVSATAPSNYERLVAEGVIRPAKRPRTRALKPIRTKGTVSDLVREQRR